MLDITDKNLIELGKAVINTESNSIKELLSSINDSFIKACKLILACNGRVICIGMGKSGHIANKIAATFASTGTPAFFVHPGEASHGDLGMITKNDVVVALSNSGETDEIVSLIPVIKRLGTPLISFTGNPNSSLSLSAAANLDVSVSREACPMGLAPTSSTTAALAMGDALAIALLTARGFTEEDFALSHPGGSLGKRLLLHVKDIMHASDHIPIVTENTSFKDLLLEMTKKALGTVIITDHTMKNIQGIFTDGDLRRVLDKDIDYKSMLAKDIMIKNCKTIDQDMLAVEALRMMETNKINALPVIDHNQQLTGIINMHDLLKAKVV